MVGERMEKVAPNKGAQALGEAQQDQIAVLGAANGLPINTDNPQLNKRNEATVRAIVERPLEKAKAEVADSTRALNPESEHADSSATYAAELTGVILTTTNADVRLAAGKMLTLVRVFQTKTEGIETPALEPLLVQFSRELDLFLKNPEAAVTEGANMEGRAATENASFYRQDVLIGVPQERKDAFVESRADEEMAIIERGRTAGKKPDEIDREIAASRRLAVRDFYAELNVAGFKVTQQMVDEGNKYVKMGDIGDDFLDRGRYSQAINARNWQEFSEVAHSAGLGFAITTGLLTLGEIASAEVKSPGAEAAAAAQFQMDNILKQKEAQQQLEDIEKLLNELKDKKESVGEAAEKGELSPEALELLEKAGIEKEDTIKEAIAEVEKIIANVELQNEKIAEIRKGFEEEKWEVGYVPFNDNPERVFLDNGLVDEDGKLTEKGKEMMPEIMERTLDDTFDFDRACSAIIFRIDAGENGELVDNLNAAKRTIEEYMASPESVEKLAAFNEVMQDPEIVAVKAAFLEILAGNAREVVNEDLEERASNAIRQGPTEE